MGEGPAWVCTRTPPAPAPDLIDRSFGFDTSFAEAQFAIRTAKVEAAGSPRGVGIVKLMGRYAGFIAAHASLASGDVDLCLIPEVPVALGGPASVLAHVERVVAERGHAVIVVAEGAGEDEMCAELSACGRTVEVDAGGNRKLPPVGEWLQGKVAAHFAGLGAPVSIRYIDPSYMIRSGQCIDPPLTSRRARTPLPAPRYSGGAPRGRHLLHAPGAVRSARRHGWPHGLLSGPD